MNKVLISGGAGFIGSFAAELFISRGYKVSIIDNLSTGHLYALPKEAEFIEADLLDKNSLQKKLAGQSFDGLIHFAAKALVAESVADPDLYYQNNVYGSINLFQVARSLGIGKIIFSSTAAVYGEPRQELNEEHDKKPLNPYGDSKLTVENYLRASCAAYGLRSIILRYFNACGAAEDGSRGEVHKPETHLIPLAVGAALGIYPELRVYGSDYPTPDGSAIRDYIHVKDLADAHLAAFQFLDRKSAGYSEPFNLGTGNGYSVLEIVNTTSKVLGVPVPYKMSERRPGDPAILVARPDKAHSILGWKASRTDLSKTIGEVGKWMSNNREKF